ncbi:PIR protein [Plasmodium ovale]|uniref:PIR Superfamily Protein n=2 Tax=Plasmodium ovale TaxID=36330 RepID=A0A1A8XC70_PLAOA|nr:PIR Superfamily Protein [Plasmodium ovale curtisi]SBT01456.1 PIR Superfamily Protein [Plasmodium ovale curtisi]SBT84648.1 PIR protein [Plasmodium ovale]
MAAGSVSVVFSDQKNYDDLYCFEKYVEIVEGVEERIDKLDKAKTKDQDFRNNCNGLSIYIEEKKEEHEKCFGNNESQNFTTIEYLLDVTVPRYKYYNNCDLLSIPEAKVPIKVEHKTITTCKGITCKNELMQRIEEVNALQECTNNNSCRNSPSALTLPQDLATSVTGELEEVTFETTAPSSDTADEVEELELDILSSGENAEDVLDDPSTENTTFSGILSLGNTVLDEIGTYVQESEKVIDMVSDEFTKYEEKEPGSIKKLFMGLIKFFTDALNNLTSLNLFDTNDAVLNSPIEGQQLLEQPISGGERVQQNQPYVQKLHSENGPHSDQIRNLAGVHHEAHALLCHARPYIRNTSDVSTGLGIFNGLKIANEGTLLWDHNGNLDLADGGTPSVFGKKSVKISISLFLIILVLTTITALLIKYTSIGEKYSDKEKKKREERRAELDRIMHQSSFSETDGIYLTCNSFPQQQYYTAYQY